MCDYMGQDFGAAYPDSVCIDGYLWDADSGNADPNGQGWIYDSGGEIPCPMCNEKAAAKYANKPLKKIRQYVSAMKEQWGTFGDLEVAEKLAASLAEEIALKDSIIRAKDNIAANLVDKIQWAEQRLSTCEEQRWIPVEEKLPSLSAAEWVHAKTGERGPATNSDDVLIYFPGGDCHIECAFYDYEVKHWVLVGHSFKEPDCDPTHWMPLPKPPAEQLKEAQRQLGEKGGAN